MKHFVFRPASRLHHLDLSGNSIGCVGAASFARAMVEVDRESMPSYDHNHSERLVLLC